MLAALSTENLTRQEYHRNYSEKNLYKGHLCTLRGIFNHQKLNEALNN